MKKLLLPLIGGSLALMACNTEQIQEVGEKIERLSHESCVNTAMAEYEAIDAAIDFDNESSFEEVRSSMLQAEELMNMIDVSDCPADFKVSFIALKADIKEVRALIDELEQAIQSQSLRPEVAERLQRIADRGSRHEKRLEEVAASFGWQAPAEEESAFPAAQVEQESDAVAAQ
ncbi:MAG TPA: hypothetical protein VN493_25245 [Thermoanaerobaculia bacterium]|nr:hypothetical protein [Thermoanaerobaculia bacterium]